MPIIPHNWSHDNSPTCHQLSPAILQSPSAPKTGSSGTEGVPRQRHIHEAFIRSSRSTVMHLLTWSSQCKASYSTELTLVLRSDTSKKGWGAHCRENSISTGEPWTHEESQAHINCLELQLAFLATQTFVKGPCHIQIFLNNQVVVAHVNHIRGTHSLQLCKIVVEFWNWCMKHQITIYAEHLPGKLNVVANYDSYHLSDCSDWKLNPETFLQLNAMQFGPFSIHLFALH